MKSPLGDKTVKEAAMSFCNYVKGETNVFGPRIYDERLGYRYFNTEQERDEYYDKAQWIDQKHWHKQNG